MRDKVVIIAFICSLNVLFSQDFQTVLNQAIEKQNQANNFKIEMLYTIYEDSISNIKKDEKKSEAIKRDNDYYFKMAESEIILTNNHYLKISHSEKMMLYANINDASSILEKNQNLFVEFINDFEERNIEDNGKYWSCILSKSTKAKLPYKKIVLTIDKQNLSIVKQVYFFNTSMQKSYRIDPNSEKHERLEIELIKKSELPEIASDIFRLEKYIHQSEGSFTNTPYTKGYKILLQ